MPPPIPTEFAKEGGWFSDWLTLDNPLTPYDHGPFDSSGEPGNCIAINYDKVLFDGESPYQRITVLSTKSFGNVVMLNGVIQHSEKDEFIYEEAIANLVMNSHPNPKKVLIIGAGFGATLREVVKYDECEEVTAIELDQMVVDVTKKYMPHMSDNLTHSKCKEGIIIGEGLAFLKQHKNEYDVILGEPPEENPTSPGIYSDDFYVNAFEALREGGVLYTFGGMPYTELPRVARYVKRARSVFPVAKLATVSLPTYGTTGLIISCKDASRDITKPLRSFTNEELDRRGLKFYSSCMHTAAFVLPRIVHKAVEAECEK